MLDWCRSRTSGKEANWLACSGRFPWGATPLLRELPKDSVSHTFTPHRFQALPFAAQTPATWHTNRLLYRLGQLGDPLTCVRRSWHRTGYVDG